MQQAVSCRVAKALDKQVSSVLIGLWRLERRNGKLGKLTVPGIYAWTQKGMNHSSGRGESPPFLSCEAMNDSWATLKRWWGGFYCFIFDVSGDSSMCQLFDLRGCYEIMCPYIANNEGPSRIALWENSQYQAWAGHTYLVTTFNKKSEKESYEWWLTGHHDLAFFKSAA